MVRIPPIWQDTDLTAGEPLELVFSSGFGVAMVGFEVSSSAVPGSATVMMD